MRKLPADGKKKRIRRRNAPGNLRRYRLQSSMPLERQDFLLFCARYWVEMWMRRQSRLGIGAQSLTGSSSDSSHVRWIPKHLSAAKVAITFSLTGILWISSGPATASQSASPRNQILSKHTFGGFGTLASRNLPIQLKRRTLFGSGGRVVFRESFSESFVRCIRPKAAPSPVREGRGSKPEPDLSKTLRNIVQ